MQKENLLQDLTNATQSLLDLARDLSFNKISDNCCFFISEIKEDTNKKESIGDTIKSFKTLFDIIPEMEKLFPELYDVNLHIYKAKKSVTIIEIQYYSRLSLNHDYQEITSRQEPTLHCKVAQPPYYIPGKKIDINWKFNTLNHKWQMFWWQLRKA